MQRSTFGRYLVPLALVLASACVSTPRGYVAREWAANMRELGITPVFPPREDVQVGDIYMAPFTPDAEVTALDEKGFLPLGLWVARVVEPGSDDPSAPQPSLLSALYSHRDSYPPTETSDATDGASAQPASAPTGGDDVFATGDVSRLRVVGFPMFMSATFNKGGLSGLVPAEAASMAFGATAYGGRDVTVSVPRAESCGLPAVHLVNALYAPSDDGSGKVWSALATDGFDPADITLYLPRQQLDALDAAREAAAAEAAASGRSSDFVPYGYVRIITEVFYARELDISIESSSGRGLAADIRPVAMPSERAAAGAAAESGEESGGEESGGELDLENATPQQLAAVLNGQLDDALGRTDPGIGTRFVSVGKRGVSLRTTFERPVAIGYRYVSLKVYADGRVEGAGAIGEATPTALRAR